MKPSEICCHRLEARLLGDCSGGNSRLSYLLRCGGRSFFDQEVWSLNLELHYGIEPTVRLLTSPDARHLVAAIAPTWAIAGVATRGDSAALSIFFWFQIPDFDLFFGFFSLCHFIFPSIQLYLRLLPIATAR